jgi:hypothetical protein
MELQSTGKRGYSMAPAPALLEYCRYFPFIVVHSFRQSDVHLVQVREKKRASGLCNDNFF